MPGQQICINGRFATQALTGVQRFASQIVTAMDRQWEDEGASPLVLSPKGDITAPSLRTIRWRQTGLLRGVLWEQVELPLQARGKLLLNLGNSAPITFGKQIIVLHDAGVFAVPDAYSPRFRFWFVQLCRVFARSPAHLITVSEFSRRELSRYLDIPAERIGLITEGAEHILQAVSDPGILCTNRLDPHKYVLAVGSLARHKNLASLQGMAERLRGRRLDLVITGGHREAVFGAKAALPESARYVGRVSDAELRALYENAACFVFPSTYEGFGLPVLEAMLCGCPVAASHAASLPEICGDAALLFDPLSPSDIADAVCRIVDRSDVAEHLRQKGFARAQLYTWSEAANSLLKHMRTISLSDQQTASRN